MIRRLRRLRRLLRLEHRHVWAGDEFYGGMDELSCRCGATRDGYRGGLTRAFAAGLEHAQQSAGHPKGRVP